MSIEMSWYFSWNWKKERKKRRIQSDSNENRSDILRIAVSTALCESQLIPWISSSAHSAHSSFFKPIRKLTGISLGHGMQMQNYSH